MVAHDQQLLQTTEGPADLHPSHTTSLKPPVACQICFEAAPRALTLLCGPTCPANVCNGCLETHITTALHATLPGILPRLRCPICLTRLAKPAWQSHVSVETTRLFASLCAKACAFTAPCCHEATYTQLPATASGEDRPTPFESFVDVRLHAALPTLQSLLTQFERYGVTARELVHFLDELVRPLRYTPLSLQEFMDDVGRQLRDDERRAALLLAFHGLHRRAITRCCFAHLCFCCKRKWDLSHEENPRGPCDLMELTDSDMVQCRACRMTLVKVEGCDAVQCPCGFAMGWSNELQLREDYARGLIPTTIDLLDVGRFRSWDLWRHQLVLIVRYELPAVRMAWRTRELNVAMAPFRLVLRRMLQTRVWRKRFQYALPDVAWEIHNVRLSRLERRLRQLGFCVGGMVRARVLVRLRRRRCLRQIERFVPAYDEDEIVDDAELRIAIGLFED